MRLWPDPALRVSCAPGPPSLQKESGDGEVA